jgi:hypothetical protein
MDEYPMAEIVGTVAAAATTGTGMTGDSGLAAF